MVRIIGTDRGEALFLVRFGFFLGCQKGQNRQHEKERKKEATRERERTNEREKERERTRENERVEGKKQPTKKTLEPQKHHFLQQRKNTHRKLCLSTHQMASPEAAAILRELQGKNGNGVRV